jgi:hypothetical protein
MKALFFCCVAFIALASIGNAEPDTAEPFFPVTVDGQDGYIDRSGKIRIKLQFVEAGAFSEGFAAVTVTPEYKEGYINRKGEWVIQPQFGGAGEFSEGLATVHTEVSLSSPTVVIDTEGQVRFHETAVSSGRPFKEGLKAVGNGRGQRGYIDRAGKIVIDVRFDQAAIFMMASQASSLTAALSTSTRLARLSSHCHLPGQASSARAWPACAQIRSNAAMPTDPGS